MLLEHKDIDVNKANNVGWTALMIVCANSGTDSTEGTVKMLLEHKDIDVNKQDCDGWTALMIVCR